jgi:hypothetical protein
VREGDKLKLAREILQSGFNFARNKLNEAAEKSKPGAVMAARVANSPASLTSRSIHGVIASALEGKISPRYIHVPQNLSNIKREELLNVFEQADEETFQLIKDAGIEMLAPGNGIAVYDVGTRILQVNGMHPFVAQFLNEYENTVLSLPLQLMAMAEVLLEAHLYQQGAQPELAQAVLERRDQLLRFLAKNTGRKNAFMVANDLREAAGDKTQLELELVNVFNYLGFEAVHKGNANKPDGVASAILSGAEQKRRSYSVSLEAKSKEDLEAKPGSKVSAKTVGISAIARQRNEFNCDHAIVVGPNFPASNEGKTALEQEIADAAKAAAKDAEENRHPARTITLIRVEDLARLVETAPRKRITPLELRELFTTCRMPEEAARWVDAIGQRVVPLAPYKEILESIAELQKGQPESAVAYTSLRTHLQYVQQIHLGRDELEIICHAMMQLASPSYLLAAAETVELNSQPIKVLELIGATAEHSLAAKTGDKRELK